MSKGISLLLIEDNRLLREGIAAIVGQQPDLQLVAAAGRLDPALLRSPRTKPDVVLLDAALRDHDSQRGVRTLKEAFPDAHVIVMGLLPVQDDVAEFVHAGVSGFILKDATADEFLRTIRAVARGAKVLPPLLTESLFSQIANEALRRGTGSAGWPAPPRRNGRGFPGGGRAARRAGCRGPRR
jgi:DNA-binding NarL/FixJ family response regulator